MMTWVYILCPKYREKSSSSWEKVKRGRCLREPGPDRCHFYPGLAEIHLGGQVRSAFAHLIGHWSWALKSKSAGDISSFGSRNLHEEATLLWLASAVSDYSLLITLSSHLIGI